MTLKNYLVDIKLSTSIRVDAEDEEAARKLIATAFNCASINAGAWPNGEPITGTASMDGEADLVEIDGMYQP